MIMKPEFMIKIISMLIYNLYKKISLKIHKKEKIYKKNSKRKKAKQEKMTKVKGFQYKFLYLTTTTNKSLKIIISS